MGSFQGWPVFIYLYSNGIFIPSKNKTKANLYQDQASTTKVTP
jgi:hypothetical protein